MQLIGTRQPQHGERRAGRERREELLRLTAREHSLAMALDRLPRPILLVVAGWPLRIWHANAAARKALASGGILWLDGPFLAVPDARHAAILGNAVRLALSEGPEHPRVVEFTLATAVLPAISLHVQALGLQVTAGIPESPLLLLELMQRTSRSEALERLCRDFGLTRTEAETAINLYLMGSVDALAREAGKSVHTVRTQLKAAMQKTDTHTQASLVALVGSRLDA